MKTQKIIVVDYEQLMRNFAVETMKKCGYEVTSAENGAEALKLVAENKFDIAFIDMRLPDMNGIEVLTGALEINPDLPVVMMATYARLENAFEALKLGAMDYIVKPFSPDQIEFVIKRINEWKYLSEENLSLRDAIERRNGYGEVIGCNEAMLNIKKEIESSAVSGAPVLITGEKGSGKKLTAISIYRKSGFIFNPLKRIKCQNFPEEDLESEIYGKSGNGAKFAERIQKRKAILFEDIEKTPAGLRSHLLNILEGCLKLSRTIGKSSASGIKIFCTLNDFITENADEKHFIKELRKIMKSSCINLPPLRERLDDVPLLAEYFIREYVNEHGMKNKKLAKVAITKLMTYSYPGNVAELKRVIHNAIAMSPDEIIKPDYILFNEKDLLSEQTADESFEIIAEAGIPLSEMERRLILKTLHSFGGNRGMTAEALKISVRTLRNKLNQYRKTDPLLVC